MKLGVNHLLEGSKGPVEAEVKYCQWAPRIDKVVYLLGSRSKEDLSVPFSEVNRAEKSG